MIKVILPKTYIKDVDAPLIYLAGPAKGAPYWQDEAIDILSSCNINNLIIVSPRELVNEIDKKDILKGDETYFQRQRAWELYYMGVASEKGAIMFWLPGEIEHNCQKSYGAMTRVELGECMANYKHNNNFGFCIGSDEKFSELNTIKYDLNIYAPDKKIVGTLEETCKNAITLAINNFTR